VLAERLAVLAALEALADARRVPVLAVSLREPVLAVVVAEPLSSPDQDRIPRLPSQASRSQCASRGYKTHCLCHNDRYEPRCFLRLR
jgi:hypothetical protein